VLLGLGPAALLGGGALGLRPLHVRLRASQLQIGR